LALEGKIAIVTGASRGVGQGLPEVGTLAAPAAGCCFRASQAQELRRRVHPDVVAKLCC
jgi:NAD(P)-dependent dehydrogenase (short-subunit alcohol dehydrogenase family)